MRLVSPSVTFYLEFSNAKCNHKMELKRTYPDLDVFLINLEIFQSFIKWLNADISPL